jgi:hypothetical protein
MMQACNKARCNDFEPFSSRCTVNEQACGQYGGRGCDRSAP